MTTTKPSWFPATLGEASIDAVVDGLAADWALAEPDPRDALHTLAHHGVLAAVADAPTLGDRIARSASLHERLGLAGLGSVGSAALTHLEVGVALLNRFQANPVARQIRMQAVAGLAVPALAVTETTGGTDLSAMTTKVSVGDEGLVVDGHKSVVTGGPIADYFLVLTADPDAGNSFGSHTLVAVPASAPGVTVGALESASLSGMLAEVSFDQVRLGHEHILGPRGGGLLPLTRHWSHERVMVSVRLVALSAFVLAKTVGYAATRRTFGASLLSRQAVQFSLAGHVADILTAKTYVDRVLREMSAGSLPPAAAAACKLLAARTAAAVSDSCVQWHGATAYVDGHPVGRVWKDAAGLAIAGGTTELMLDLVDRSIK